MQRCPTAIAEIVKLVPKRHGDERGWFMESYNRRTLQGLGIDACFVQDNQSLSRPTGTVRGLHFQTPPFAQAKLVGVLAGAILDVVVDIRRGSPSFGRHVAVELTAAEGELLYVPEGFAHGFATLEPDSRIFYKVTNYYSREHDRGIGWNDPALGIDWRVAAGAATLSEKDRAWPTLAESPTYFEFA
ncbi:MAG: dTDP-4-dehydrorhamnose 3,5-epimerase [Alphaproteobacteria bacterium]|nr:dTDP-4-dehydrorhamnose 3,5-epimerase [Alphaproteobacteria bacterium]